MSEGSDTPNFDELVSRLTKLLETLEAREFGLFTWRESVYEQGVEIGKFFGKKST